MFNIFKKKTSSQDKNIRKTRFAIADLQKRISVLDATHEDISRQLQKLSDSVPEEKIDASASKDGYVAYGSYAQRVIELRNNLRISLQDISEQSSALKADLETAIAALDSFERVKAKQIYADL